MAGGALQFGPNVQIDVRNWSGAGTCRNLLKLLVLIMGFSACTGIVSSLFAK